MLDTMLNSHGVAAYIIVLAVLVASAFGLPIPEDLSLIAAGMLVHLGKADTIPMAIICYIGLITGDVVIYRLGHLAGPAVFRRRWVRRHVTASRLQKIRANLERRTFTTILIARHLFYLRTVTFLVCGAVRVNFMKFIIADSVAALFTTPLMMGMGYLFAEHYDTLITYVKRVKIFLVWAGIAAGAGIAIYIRSVHKQQDALEALDAEEDLLSNEDLPKGQEGGSRN